MKLIKYAISFFLFFSFPINVFAVVFVLFAFLADRAFAHPAVLSAPRPLC